MSLPISNGIADNWFNRCCAINTSVFNSFFITFKLIFHFDSLNWIAIELLIIIPIFFRLYGFGIQQKLTKFYNKARLQILNFLFYFSLITVISALLQFLMPRNPACLQWDGANLVPLRNDFGSPSIIIMLTTILFLMFLKADFTGWKIVIIVVGFFWFFTTTSSVLSGCSSIFQALLSVCFGSWIFFTFNFLPPIFVIISYVVIATLAFTYFIPEVVKAFKESLRGIPELHDAYKRYLLNISTMGIRSTVLLTIIIILFILNARSIDGFKWFEMQWYEGLLTRAKDDSIAIIPQVMKITEEDKFDKKITKDIIFSLIAFVAVLGLNSFFVATFNVPIYNV